MVFNKINNYLKQYRIRSIFKPLHEDFFSIKPIETIHEDPSAVEAFQIASRVFNSQQQQMQARAMKAHSSECVDSWTCTKDPCWEFVPDKIVGSKSKNKNKTDKIIDRDFLFDR